MATLNELHKSEENTNKNKSKKFILPPKEAHTCTSGQLRTVTMDLTSVFCAVPPLCWLQCVLRAQESFSQSSSSFSFTAWLHKSMGWREWWEWVGAAGLKFPTKRKNIHLTVPSWWMYLTIMQPERTLQIALTIDTYILRIQLMIFHQLGKKYFVLFHSF